MTTIDITNITGLSYPYDIYACDVYGNNCILISTIFTSIPPSNTILLPPQFENSPLVGLKIITLDGCEKFKVIDCYSVIPPFISIWDTTNTSGGSSLSNQIQLPLVNGVSYYFNIDWGDGNSDIITTWNQTETLHTYSIPGVYTLKISGNIPDWSFGASLVPDSEKILSITQWGCLQFGQYETQTFYNCSNLDLSTVNDIPNLTYSNSFNNTFDGCYSLTTINNSNLWDVSNIQTFVATFNNCLNFNSDISSWDTSNIIDMNYMFAGCSSFNSDISSWDVSNVTNMYSMFNSATIFNQPLSGWNVSNVTSMGYMFVNTQFNQPIDNWNVGSVTNMEHMFQYSNFNQSIGGWDVSIVTDMNNMFTSSPFNQDINSWDVSSVTNMDYMFFFATTFNQNLNWWDVSSVTNMDYMFFFDYAFAGNITSWDTSNVTSMRSMFGSCTFFNQDISGWNVSSVTNMSGMFVGATFFNQPIGSWDVSNVTNMSNMFSSGAFNQNIGSWNVTGVTNFNQFMYGKSYTDFSTTNLDAIYNGWSSLPTLTYGIHINFGTIKYTLSGQSGKDILEGTSIGQYGWVISDGGI